MKKLFIILSTAFILSILACTAVMADDIKTSVDTANTAKGYITVKVVGATSNKILISVKKDSDEYKYYLTPGVAANLPLQLGKGSYTVTFLENIAGTKYRIISAEEVTANNIDENQVYLNSIQKINFNDDMTAIKELNKLSASAKNDKEKVELIYNYIVKNISYDYDKVSQVSAAYLPVIDDIYSKKLGICQDYASLFASILRDNGIQAKMQVGYFSEISEYHAWNEILLDEKWVKIDTTYDAQADSYKISYSMVKDNLKFTVIGQY